MTTHESVEAVGMGYAGDNSMEITYRSAKENDIDAIWDLVSCAIKNMEDYNISQWDDLYPTREDFLTDIQKGELFVGLLKDKIAVIYTLNKECDDKYQDGEWKYPNSEFRVIHRLCVHPSYQNRGIARSTLMYIESKLSEEYIDTIRLDVFSNNPFALKLYGNNGYEKVGSVDWRKGKFFLMEKHL